MKLTPQDLIDLPGYGQAQKHLIRQKQWDCTVELDGTKECIVKVKVMGSYHPEPETQYFEVVASTQDEAMDKAAELSDLDEIDDCEILEVKERNE